MKSFKSWPMVLAGVVAFVGTGVAGTLSGQFFNRARPMPAKITGDYVEARTASVMAGACHYNGELDTTGRDAVMAWSFTGGSYDGVDLSGVKAVAAVTSAENLSDTDSPHKAELAVDPSASEKQVAALEALLEAKCGTSLGKIVAVRREPVMFTHGKTGYAVQAGNFAEMVVDYRADNACCIQPNLVWYSPLTPLDHRMVGYTEVAGFNGTIAEPWQRAGEDGAFYGAFTF